MGFLRMRLLFKNYQGPKMFGRVVDVLIVGLIILFLSFDLTEAKYPEDLRNTTSCEEFGKAARFNPYSILDTEWFVFYYWGPDMPSTIFLFDYPAPNAKAFLHHILDEHVKTPINWTARFVVMHNLSLNQSSLLVETGDRGQYLMYHLRKRTKNSAKIEAVQVLFKQFDGGKYIAYMECTRQIVYLMSKRKDIPPKNKLQDEAAKAGFRSRGGKSYLYQGHQWMPIPEMDEQTFWMENKVKKEKEALELMRIEADMKLKDKKERMLKRKE